jgi:SnoaL-like domain
VEILRSLGSLTMGTATIEELQSQLLAFRDELGQLRSEVTRLNDIQAIRTLHFKYGYYWDNVLYEQVIDLFTDDVKVSAILTETNSKLYFRGGLYHGKEGARRIYQSNNKKNGPPHGFMINHHQLQDVVTVAPTGDYAYGRFHMLMFGGLHTEALDSNARGYEFVHRQFIEQGMYENEYRKENGIWKCCVFRYKEIWMAPFDLSAGGWAEVKRGTMFSWDKYMTTRAEGNDNGPDEKAPEYQWMWPDRKVFPYHYPHPVSSIFLLLLISRLLVRCWDKKLENRCKIKFYCKCSSSDSILNFRHHRRHGQLGGNFATY